MMGSIGGDKVLKMKERKGKKESSAEPQISKFIINPNNFWNMQWNNLTQLVFIVWIVITPMLIS